MFSVEPKASLPHICVSTSLSLLLQQDVMDKFLFMERQTRRGGGHKKEFPPQSFQFLYQE